MTASATVEKPLRTASLRRRVAVWMLLLLVVVLTALGLVVNWLLGDALRSDLQQRLEDKASYAAVLQEQGITGQSLADRLTGGGVFSSFTSGNQQFIGRDADPVGPPPGGRPGPRPQRPIPAVAPTVTFNDADGRLTATVGLRSGTLVLSTNESDIATTLGPSAADRVAGRRRHPGRRRNTAGHRGPRGAAPAGPDVGAGPADQRRNPRSAAATDQAEHGSGHHGRDFRRHARRAGERRGTGQDRGGTNAPIPGRRLPRSADPAGRRDRRCRTTPARSGRQGRARGSSRPGDPTGTARVPTGRRPATDDQARYRGALR